MNHLLRMMWFILRSQSFSFSQLSPFIRLHGDVFTHIYLNSRIMPLLHFYTTCILLMRLPSTLFLLAITFFYEPSKIKKFDLLAQLVIGDRAKIVFLSFNCHVQRWPDGYRKKTYISREKSVKIKLFSTINRGASIELVSWLQLF